MRSSSGPDPVLLSHPFKRERAWLPFGRLVLFSDHIEYRVLGRVRETIALADVRDVHWQTSDTDATNFALLLEGGSTFAGHLRGAGLWKAQLQELMKRPRKTARPSAKAAAPALERSAA